MTIQFERRADRPDAAGRCVIHLRAYFDGQRLRMATAERCLAAEWNEDKGRFRKSFSGYQDANDSLEALGERLAKAYRGLRTSSVTPRRSSNLRLGKLWLGCCRLVIRRKAWALRRK